MYVILQGLFFDLEITIIGTYAPNANLAQYWYDIFIILQNLDCKHVLLMGDFNAVMNSQVKMDQNTRDAT